jgi:hypothetical protein
VGVKVGCGCDDLSAVGCVSVCTEGDILGDQAVDCNRAW